MSRRELFLREMGLGPVWRLRTRDGAQTGEPCDAKASESAGAQASQAPAASPPSPMPAGMDEDRQARILAMDWPAIKASVSGCVSCPLHRTRTNTVFGVGDERAQWLLVGEAPGAEEDSRGEPFVGQAGRLLDNMLAAIGLKRGVNVYIANVLKCRPPGNRNPEPGEVEQCVPYLARQIALIEPKLIIAMGRFAAQTLLDTGASIASLRGRVHRYRGVPMIVSYHPAYLLRSLHDKAKAWEDLCLARRVMAELCATNPG